MPSPLTNLIYSHANSDSNHNRLMFDEEQEEDDYDISDTSSSTEWIDIPTDESLTFVEYQWVRALPNIPSESQQTSSNTLSTHSNYVLHSDMTGTSPAADANGTPVLTLPLPIAIAYPTGITIQQLTSDDDDNTRHYTQQTQTPPPLAAATTLSSSFLQTDGHTYSPKEQHGWKRCRWRWWKQRRQRRRIFLGILSLIILILSFMATILAIQFKGTHPSTSSMAEPPFINNSTDSERFLWQTIQNYTNYESYISPTTPQRKAWNLLLYDLQHDRSGNFTNHPSRIRQRFAISTLFFLYPQDSSTSSWFYKASLQAQHECLWSFSSKGVLNCTSSGVITQVNLNTQGLSGSLPIEMGMLSYLQYISLANNNIHGTIPPTFSTWNLLYTIDFSMNSLSGTLPNFISTFSDLRSLRFDHNKFQGPLPSSWDAPQLPKLTIFVLSHNSLSGSIQPSTWGNFTQLSILDLSNNSFTGVTPNGLKYAQNIQSLSISYNSFTGSQDVICSLDHAVSLTTDCLSSKMGVTFTTIIPTFPCDCCTTCCSKTEGCFPQIGRVTGPHT